MNWKDKLTDEMLEQVGTVMKAMSDTTKDHSHCWKSKTPPCGQKIEHLKCCLCEKLNPKVQSTLREELEDILNYLPIRSDWDDDVKVTFQMGMDVVRETLQQRIKELNV